MIFRNKGIKPSPKHSYSIPFHHTFILAQFLINSRQLTPPNKHPQMIVERQTTASISHSPSPMVKFLIVPSGYSSKERCYQVNLALYKTTNCSIRLSDSGGALLMEETELKNQTYIIRNLGVGTYFFEVTDGFYCQIKELRIL